MELTLEQYKLIEPDDAMIKRVEKVINETGFGQVSKTIKIQNSLIVLEEYDENIKRKP
jgi:hypothetical protein